MNRDRMFELRVLTGTHAGASVLLPEGGQVLGSSDDCDLILSDEGVLAQHARLEHQDDGSTVLRWLDGNLPPLVIRPGEGAVVGPVRIAVEASGTPWRTDVPIQQPAPEPGALGADGTELILSDDDARAAPPAQATAHPAQALHRSLASNLTLAALTLLAVGSIVLVWWTWQRNRPVPAPTAAMQAAAQAGAASAPNASSASAPTATGVTPSAATATATPAVIGRDPVTETVARLNLGERVQVQPRTGQTPLVHASLLSDDDTDRLATALSRLSPRPGLRLLSPSDVQATIDAVLEGHKGSSGRTLSARYVDGRFSVRGRVADESARDSLLAELAKALPTVRDIDSAVQTDAQAATAMVEDLRGQGVGGVSGAWNAGVLALQVDLSPAEVPRWERALLAAASRHQLPFRATLNLREGPPPAPVRLPFTVRSVMSSEMPYVVLSDGRKLVAGATVSGWQLMEIRVDAVVFEGAEGRRITLER